MWLIGKQAIATGPIRFARVRLRWAGPETVCHP
jgi:hypothetical protein